MRKTCLIERIFNRNNSKLRTSKRKSSYICAKVHHTFFNKTITTNLFLGFIISPKGLMKITSFSFLFSEGPHSKVKDDERSPSNFRFLRISCSRVSSTVRIRHLKLYYVLDLRKNSVNFSTILKIWRIFSNDGGSLSLRCHKRQTEIVF